MNERAQPSSGLIRRLRTATTTVERHVPAFRAAVGRARRVRARARLLRRWSAEDPDALKARLDLALALAEPPTVPLLRPATRSLIRCSKPGSPRGVICSLATDRHISLLSVAAPTLLDYGERHGWDVVLSTEELAGGRAPSWGKVPLIRELLADYDLVWWIDADALVVDSSVDIRDELLPDRHLHVVEHLFPWPSSFAASAGVMVWRAGARSEQLLDDLWADERYAQGYPWENGALLDALGYTADPCFMHLDPTERIGHIGLLSSAWNSVWSDPAPTPRIHHHGGDITFEDRRLLMLGDLARFRRGEPPVIKAPPGRRVLTSTSARTFLSAAAPSSAMSRDDLPLLLNQRSLLGTGAEIGTFTGEYSARLLTRWAGRLLISIDPWAAGDEDYLDVSNVGQASFDRVATAARVRLERFGERSAIWRLTSEQAAAKVADAGLDFVYIDARHDEAAVRHDLDLWWPKVRGGGILAGHDYVDGHLPEGRFGVKSAVDAFFGDRGLVVHVTGESGFPTWVVEVPARRASTADPHP